MRKKKPLLLVTFLLMLYIAPMLFVLSYNSSAIPTQPNTTKDFAISADWYDADFHYRQKINIMMYSGVAGTDYQVLIEVEYDSDMQADFDDIIFVDEDHDTLFDHWLESKNDTVAYFWVEIADYMDSTLPTISYMYYGNEEASSTSNGDATFLFFDDFSGDAINDTKWNITQGQEPDDLDVTGGKLLFLNSADENTMLRADGYAGSTGGTALEMSVYWYALWQFRCIGWSAWRADGYFSYDGDIASIETVSGDTIDCEDDGDNGHISDNPNLSNEVWNRIGMYYLSDAHHEFWINGIEKQDYTTSVPDATMYPFFGTHSADSYNEFKVDWLYIRSIVENDDFSINFGEEQTNIVPDWELIIDIDAFFVVGIYTGTLDMILIFLGLILIPASTLYLVKGGKDEMSSDKLFYFLVVFIIGWGLFLGGIYG